MKSKILLNESGFTLVTAVVALVVISATSVYLMDINKKSSQESSIARATSLIELERNKISSALSSNNTCALLAGKNFNGKPAVNGAGVLTLVSASGADLATVGNSYYLNRLKVKQIISRVAVAGDENVGDVGTDKQYVLEITYENYSAASVDNAKALSTGKRTSTLKIPMYMKMVAGVVKQCYATAQNNNVNIAVKDSCSPAIKATPPSPISDRAHLNLGSTATTESDCEHTMIFDPVASPSSTCAKQTAVPTTGTSFTGFSLSGEKVTWTIGNTGAGQCHGINMVCPTGTHGIKTVYDLTNSVLACDYPLDGAHDATNCAAGQIVYMSSTAAAVTCVTASCTSAGTYDFINAITTSTSCIVTPTAACPAGQYIKQFNGAAPPTCDILPTWTGNCLGQFGTSVTRNNSTAAGQLNCTPYTKSKNCAAPSAITFPTSFNTTTTAPCQTF